MADYPGLIIAGLLIAAALNIYQPRAVILCFVAAVFLVFARKYFSEPDKLPDFVINHWFAVLALLEASFICLALATQAKQRYAVAALSAWNIFGHLIGYISFLNNFALIDFYSAIIRFGELGQVAALILLSKPIIYFSVWYKNMAGEKDHDGYQSVAATG